MMITDVEVDDDPGEIRVHVSPNATRSVATRHALTSCDEQQIITDIANPLVLDDFVR